MLSGASWEKTAAERRYNPLSYPLKMPRQKKLKLNSRFSFIQASLLWWEAFHGGPRDEVDRNAHIQSPQRPRKHFSSFPSCLFPEFLFNSTNKGLHSKMIYWGHTPEWLKYWARLNRTRRKGFKLHTSPTTTARLPSPCRPTTDPPVLLVTTAGLVLLSQDLTLPLSISRQGRCFISLVPSPQTLKASLGSDSDEKSCQWTVTLLGNEMLSSYKFSPHTVWEQKALSTNWTRDH